MKKKMLILMKGSLASTELLVSFLFLFILSTVACIIAGPDEYIDEHGNRISDCTFDVRNGEVYPDCTFILVANLF
jgi:hypothetical protein